MVAAATRSSSSGVPSNVVAAVAREEADSRCVVGGTPARANAMGPSSPVAIGTRDGVGCSDS